VVVYEKYN